MIIKGIGGGVLGQNGDLSDSYSPSAKFSDAFYWIEKACCMAHIIGWEVSRSWAVGWFSFFSLFTFYALSTILEKLHFLAFNNINIEGNIWKLNLNFI